MTSGRPGGAVVWVTGLPASGKSTLARRLRERLAALGRPAALLDGDEVRARSHPRPGYDPAARAAFYETLGDLALLPRGDGLVAVVAATANRRAFRDRVRRAGPAVRRGPPGRRGGDLRRARPKGSGRAPAPAPLPSCPAPAGSTSRPSRRRWSRRAGRTTRRSMRRSRRSRESGERIEPPQGGRPPASRREATGRDAVRRSPSRRGAVARLRARRAPRLRAPLRCPTRRLERALRDPAVFVAGARARARSA